MLTRLEARGFKNLSRVDLDFGTFTCIFGGNGVGKSNIFDAVQFLSLLADHSFGEAAQLVRSSSSSRSGDARDIFWGAAVEDKPTLRLTAEMLVPSTVEDDLGSPATPTTTFLRYEVELGYEPPADEVGIGRISLRHESLVHITRGQAAKRLTFPHAAKDFRTQVVTGQRRGGPFLSTEDRDGSLVVNVHGDGGSFGRPQPRSAERTNRTVLSTITTNDSPTILAARREMQGWRRISLEPSALRTPDSFSSSRRLGPDGAHLAATLHRIANSPAAGKEPDPDAVYARISGRLSELLGSRVVDICVDRDVVRETLTLYLSDGEGLRLPARALSEGTLRFLALCVLLEDPSFTGVLCMEEPENGIHPANLGAMMQLLQDLAVDPMAAPNEDNPFRQVIVNTHSPGVVQLCDPEDLVYAKLSGRPGGGLVVAGYDGSWRTRAGSAIFTPLDALPYLRPPKGVQFELPLELSAS